VSEKTVTRKLTTILYADVVGYSRLTGSDELGTHRAVMNVLDYAHKTIEAEGGTVLRYAGDAVLAEFSSVVSCVNAAVVVQTELATRNQDVPEERQVLIRIGINLGEVLQDRGEIYGEGVNIAARLESLAPPGGVCITGQVAEQIAGRLDARVVNTGRHKLKNISKPIEVWCWPAESARKLRRTTVRRRWAVPLGAASAVAVMAILYLLVYQGEKPSAPTGSKIAVIPFEDLTGNPDDAYFSDGLTKDINAQLSKFSNLFVFAPSSVSGFRDNLDCKTIRNELSADYILGGTVQRSLDKLRVTTTFTDAQTCRQLDAPGPFDRDLSVANVLDIQLEIAKKVVAEVGSADAPLINASVQNAIRRKAPDNLETYQCVLLSYWFYETFEPDRHRKARACLENAINQDAEYSLGWSRLAFSYMESKKYAIDTPPDWAELSRAAANRAIDLDPDNPDAHYALAILTQMTSQDLVEFRNFAERAVKLNPNDAFVLADLGTWMGYAGQWEKGKEWVARAMLLNPKHQSWWYQVWHLDHYLKGEYQESRDAALKMNLPGNYMVQASLTAAYAMNGEQEKAEKSLAHLLELRPDYPDDPRAPFRTRGMPVELIEGLMEGLRKVGLDVKPAE
jgi:class 3 adenylate cyclase/TolB-like protein